ncbi:MAG TPA: hypothetical protein VHI13_02455 [Candidatus Kapabacteria bacterium]|nr:hypothetical protein [Candidatus Kapabacteria bacterium]
MNIPLFVNRAFIAKLTISAWRRVIPDYRGLHDFTTPPRFELPRHSPIDARDATPTPGPRRRGAEADRSRNRRCSNGGDIPDGPQDALACGAKAALLAGSVGPMIGNVLRG